MRTTLSFIKHLVNIGAATDISTWPTDMIDELALRSVAYSHGVNGTSGKLLIAYDGRFYAVTKRCSNLYYTAY